MRSGMDTVTGRSEPQDPCKVGMEALPGSDCNRSEYAIPFRIQSILEKNERGATDVSAVACPSTGAMHPQPTGTTHANHFDDELRQAVASFRYGPHHRPRPLPARYAGDRRQTAREYRASVTRAERSCDFVDVERPGPKLDPVYLKLQSGG